MGWRSTEINRQHNADETHRAIWSLGTRQPKMPYGSTSSDADRQFHSFEILETSRDEISMPSSWSEVIAAVHVLRSKPPSQGFIVYGIRDGVRYAIAARGFLVEGGRSNGWIDDSELWLYSHMPLALGELPLGKKHRKTKLTTPVRVWSPKWA
jgi:hypothetical protein